MRESLQVKAYRQSVSRQEKFQEQNAGPAIAVKIEAVLNVKFTR